MFTSRRKTQRAVVHKDDRSDALFYKEIHAIADRGNPKVRRSFLEAVDRIKNKAGLAVLEKAVATRSVDAILTVLGLLPADSAYMSLLAQELSNVYNTAGKASALGLAGSHALIASTGFRFDLTNPNSIEFLNKYTFPMLKGLDAQTVEGVRLTVRNAFERGGHPFDQAIQIRDLIGLTPRQATAASNYRTALEATEGVTASAVERRTAAYADRLLLQRAETIARTETIRAANLGQLESWNQAIAQDLLPADVKIAWIVTPDDLLCPICDSLDGQEVTINEEFATSVALTEEGARKFFGAQTPPIHPSCRCAIGIV